MPEQKWTELLNSFEKTYDCAWSGLFKWLMLKTLVDWTNAIRLFAQCTFWGHQHVNAMQWASSMEKTVSFVGPRTILWCHYTWIIRMIYDYWDFTVVLSTDKQTSNHLKKTTSFKKNVRYLFGDGKKTVVSNQYYWFDIWKYKNNQKQICIRIVRLITVKFDVRSSWIKVLFSKSVNEIFSLYFRWFNQMLVFQSDIKSMWYREWKTLSPYVCYVVFFRFELVSSRPNASFLSTGIYFDSVI